MVLTNAFMGIMIVVKNEKSWLSGLFLTPLMRMSDNFMSKLTGRGGNMSLKQIFILVLGLGFIALLGACGGGDNGTTPTNEGPPSGSSAHPWGVYSGVSVDFIDRTYRVSNGPTEDPKDIDPIFYHLASARSSLDMAFSRIDRQEVVDAILSAANSVHVRILTEKAFAEDAHYRPFIDQLRAHPNIEVRTDLDGTPRLMHERFIIIDNARVVTGSYNWSEEGSERTMGDMLVINDSRVANAFLNEFNQMFVEGRFGAEKSDVIQHSFQVGSGLGIVEVYFGPTNPIDQILEQEIEQSNHVAGIVQQFSSASFANFVIQWLSGLVGAGDPTLRSMHLVINDIGAYGSAEENTVYSALAGLLTGGPAQETEGIPATLAINQPPSSDWVGVGARVNHKVLFADHAAGTGIPSVCVSTANWTTQGFTLNDEVLVVLRGVVLATKYHYLLSFNGVPHFGSNFITPDVREIEQVLLMHPFATNGTGADVPRDPALADVSCGLIHGKVDNFRREFSYQDQSGNLVTQLLDIQWVVEGEYYFGGPITPYVYPTFDESELTNPDHNYVLAVPAGNLTITAVVVDDSGNELDAFTPVEKKVEIGPGGVKNVNFSITAPVITGGAGGGGVGGGGGGVGGGGGGGVG